MSKKVLITGTSSGFGKLITGTLLSQGDTVVASMRDIEGRNRQAADELRGLGAKVVELDVTDDSSVEAGVAAAIDAADGLDVLVNNAGIGVLGLQETFTPDDWKKLFEVNVFGVQRVTRAVLPTLRQQQSGLLMFVSSILGRIVLPFLGPYNASKFALEALADNYRSELSAYGIDSVVVEPGGYGTSFADSLLQPSDADRVAELGDYADAPAQMMEAFGENLVGENAPDPQWVADAVGKLVAQNTGERPFRTVIDGLGMGEPIDAYNKVAEEVTAGIYGSFEMGDMLKVKVEA